jgi:hypothetical protein
MKYTERPVVQSDHSGPGRVDFGPSQSSRDTYRRMVNRYTRLRKAALAALLLTSAWGITPVSAQDRETLTWVLRDFPPLTTAERDKTILFSIPTYATPGNGVTIERSNHGLFEPFVTGDGHLDLTALLASDTVKVGIVGERSYGPVIDKIIRQTSRPQNLVLHYGNAAVGSMLQMERLDRFQAIVSYWPEARFHAQQQGIPLNELEFFPVKDAPKYQFAHIGCSKNDKGRAAMDIINREMRVLRVTRLIGFYAEWMVKKEEYLHDAQTFFDESEH